VVVGRYRSAANTALTLRGTVNGQPASYIYEDIRFTTSGGADFIPRLWATRKIGYLLTQIRLHGSQKETVDQVVELSVRYGIVTPYTSFLVDETEDALSADGRRALSGRASGGGAAPQAKLGDAGRGGGGTAPTVSAPTQSASGAKAVEKSIAQEALRQADVAAAPQSEQVRTVGDKTFVLRDGVWTDTTFDTQTMTAERVAFGSERYFELTRAHPEWGRYLALGPRAILVAQGRAYHIGAEGASAPQGKPPSLSPTAPPSYPAPDGTPSPTPASGIWNWVYVWLRHLRGEP
jgi:Ca-activated chloride channel homolog